MSKTSHSAVTWWRSGLARFGVRTPTGRDTVVAAALAAAGLSRVVLVLTGVVGDVSFSRRALAAAHLLATADLATIAVRRRYPRAALAVATVVPLLSGLLATRPPWIGLGTVVAAYTLATLLPRRTAAIWITAGMAAHAFGGIAVVAAGGDLGGLLTFWGVAQGDLVEMVIAAMAAYWLPGLVGSYVQTRRAYTAALAARLAWLEREREERAQAAVVEERIRIARELHDIAAHDLSAIVVQAGAADRLLDHDPAAARATLKAIRAQGRDTLAALRGLVGIMRAAGSGAAEPNSPRPSLARLDELVRLSRDAGMTVDVVRHGEPGPLPLTVDLAAYRVIQEALTNARQHAPGAPVTITTRLNEEGLRIIVRNPAPATKPRGTSADGGHGLLGMRERVQHAGGTLAVGTADDGGWQVDARFPAARPPEVR